MMIRKMGRRLQLLWLALLVVVMVGSNWLYPIFSMHFSAARLPTSTPMGVIRRLQGPRLARGPLDFSHVEVFISLTSIPSRLRLISPTINSLLRQTVFAPVVVYLPTHSRVEQQPYQPPEVLLKPPYVQIRWVDADYGPATKYIPALMDTAHLPRPPKIIVVDDDVIYFPEFVQTLWNFHLAAPGAALCLRGWPIPRDLEWANSPTVFSTEVDTPQRVGVITATHGYFVSASMMDMRVVANFLRDTPRDITFVDDVWISGHLSQQNVSKFVIPSPRGPFPNLFALSTPDLGHRRRERNNAALRYFQRFWKPEELMSS
eukprot:RCo045985